MPEPDPEDALCADCFVELDDHCTECGECWCENEECQDEDEEADE
jgi:hypothetical protein